MDHKPMPVMAVALMLSLMYGEVHANRSFASAQACTPAYDTCRHAATSMEDHSQCNRQYSKCRWDWDEAEQARRWASLRAEANSQTTEPECKSDPERHRYCHLK